MHDCVLQAQAHEPGCLLVSYTTLGRSLVSFARLLPRTSVHQPTSLPSGHYALLAGRRMSSCPTRPKISSGSCARICLSTRVPCQARHWRWPEPRICSGSDLPRSSTAAFVNLFTSHWQASCIDANKSHSALEGTLKQNHAATERSGEVNMPLGLLRSKIGTSRSRVTM